MKLLTIIFSLFLSVNALAQTADQKQGSSRSDSSLIVVDGEIYKGDIKAIKPQDILSVSILTDSSAEAINEKRLPNGAMVIVTKQFAIASYQKKFGTFNPKYKNYIALKHDDSNLEYVLNNTIMNVQRKSAITELYQLSPDKIDKVTFKKDSHFTTDATVIITTKE